MIPKRVHYVEIPSPHPLPEASRRVQALHTRGDGLFASKREILATVTPSATQARVYLHRDAGRNLIAEVHADLQPAQGGSVIIGTASVHALTWYLPLLVAFFVPIPLGVFFVLGSVDGPPPYLLLLGLPFAFLGVGLMYWQSARNRAHLVAALAKALA